ncbi:MAG: single-stranded-DNA-specific exonuclease RecJ [bacterium]|nr:single-stranded-DNA-specific exonuclease RecJ [bacterium]
MKSHWNIKKVNSPAAAQNSDLFNLDERLAAMLCARGIEEPEQVFRFLYPGFSDLHSPFRLKGAHEAVARIRQALEKREKIGVFADSDLDGLTSLVILHTLFARMNVDIFYRFPKNDETYGLSRTIIDEFKKENVDLVITVDSGIRDVEEISYGKSCGIDFIISDHHEQDTDLPDAIIVNPKQDECGYPFKSLAGVGVAFKLGHAVLLSYLPGYNRLFMLIAEDGDFASVSCIRNSIVETMEEQVSSEEQEKRIAALDEHDRVIVFGRNRDKERALELQEKFPDRKIYKLEDFIQPLLRSPASQEKIDPEKLSIEEIAGLFSRKGAPRKMPFMGTMTLVNKIFLDIQAKSSAKIYDFLCSVMGFVSIGTIADIMPLVEENRSLVKLGLEFLSRTEHRGLSVLLEDLFMQKEQYGSTGTQKKTVSSKMVGWDIAPLLNTPGRFGKSSLTADFFLENDPEKIASIITAIKTMNKERKDLVKELFTDIIEEIKSSAHEMEQSLIFVQSEKVPDGLSGLLANRICNDLNKPVILISTPGKEGVVKGSGRSSGDFDFFSFVEALAHKFERLGGHKQAFGFSVKLEAIDEIIEELQRQIAQQYTGGEKTKIDLELGIEQIDSSFIDSLAFMEPYGKDNEEPLFLTRNVLIEEFTRFGKEKNHGRYTIKTGNNIRAIGWKLADEMEQFFNNNSSLDIVYRLENNEYNGYVNPRMIIVDICDCSPVSS